MPSLLSASVAYDSLRQARVEVYRLLNMDTTTPTILPNAMVNNFINVGIAQVNEDFSAYQRTDTIQTVKNQGLYRLDSVVQINSCWLISENTLMPLIGLSMDSLTAKFFETLNITEEDKPQYYYKWGDSVGFFPKPSGVDTFKVFFTHTIPLDSMRLLPYKYRYGAIVWGAYVAAVSIGSPKAPLLYQYYGTFLGSKKMEVGK